jgi:hypothetical protein|tara:strand:+ start:152 stop:502 length:351 start_codon:yes stop_codon:yes gene_type:complete
MAQLNLKIKLYAKSKGVNSVDFLTDVIIEQPAGEEAAIKTWNLSIDEPTTEQLNSFETAGNTAETLKGVLNTRANEYKQLKEQLDLLYHDMTAGKLDNTGEWHKHIKKVKDDNPKE